ncbi:DNA primase [Candidatus Viridilinea mediisalina]|uniref:DNA primase n=1 Tax=Candidatus Viridilinea mediisalina TaxID=2024553 RepID=A0A2A6RFT4_9CHLR|nr:DNA primase [Candidatus Viridilinea mediisalina]PDW01803.1 DNA primase [Candidatus Viridilinea mediisalina]
MSNQIDEIRDKLDIADLISSMGVNLRKTGRSFVGFCPFHPNSRTPAFTVYPDTQSFYCFGCHAAGTAFDFVMRKQGIDFRTALELLAARAGVQLKPRSEAARQEDARRTRLLELTALAAKVFHHLLVATAKGAEARAYVEQRQINATTVETFQLGYSADEWGQLFTYLSEKKGFAPEEIEAAGLAIRHESGRYYDRFRGRLIFPIRNAKGEVVGFGGRALGDGQPKYLNTPETLLYKKGELLYGLDLAREAIRAEDRTVVVEGYIDVISAHQHGFRNVVAPLGTALTKAHANLLKRLSHNVFLALDADAAGQRATLKGLHALRESSGQDGAMVPTAQGVLRLESDVALRIIQMPEGRDPDDVIRADPEHWQRLVHQAVPVMEFYLVAYTAGLDLSQPEAQRRALERLLPLLQELNGAQQRVYVSRIEQVIGIRAELIIDLLRGGSSGAKGSGKKPWSSGRRGQTGPTRPSPTLQVPVDAPPPSDDDAPHPAESGYEPEPEAEADAAPKLRLPPRSDEGYLLGLALRHPTVDAAIEAFLEEGLAKHPLMRERFGGGIEDLLDQPVHQALWRQIATLPIEERPTQQEALLAWIEALDEPLRDLAQQLITMSIRPDNFRYRQEAENCARKLRVEQVKQHLAHLYWRARTTDDEQESLTIALTLTRVNSYLSSLQTPRRISTFPDLRNTLGVE